MNVTVSLKRKYVPEWNGNREDNSPITVIHKAPTNALREQLLPKPKIKFKIGAEGAEGGETEMEVDNTRIIKEMTVEIQNFDLTITDEDTGETVKQVSITKASDLYRDDIPVDTGGLLDELGIYYQQLLQKRVPTKN